MHVTRQSSMNSSKKDDGLIGPKMWQPPPFLDSWNDPIDMGVENKRPKQKDRRARDF